MNNWGLLKTRHVILNLFQDLLMYWRLRIMSAMTNVFF